jgi:hypothetical protein
MPLKNELNQSTLDLFGSTSLTSDGTIPIGLIRIPMKELAEDACKEDDFHAEGQTVMPFDGGQAALGRNFRLAGDRQLAAGWKHRGQDNIAAIRTLQAIEAEGRAATPAEQAILIKFCAFSSTELAQNIFRRGTEPSKEGWVSLADELETLVSAEEKAGLMRATQYAHYTPEYIIRAMWQAVTGFGFAGGNVLEPGCGTGLFIAASPDEIAETSHFSGIEADPITARIAALLYPESDIRHEDFTKAKLAEGYDLAIGNPPFSDRTQRFTGVSPAAPFSLHDYFIAQSIYHLRPGGLAAFVVSRWTMDKLDPAARKLIGQVADLIGAIRLPERAMRQDAGTDVVVDLLFFRRRVGDEAGNGLDWMTTGEALPATDDNGAFHVNRYFLDRPGMVLGKHGRTSSPYGLVYTCDGETGDALNTAINAAIATLPRDIHQPRPEAFRRPADRAAKFYRGTVADGATIREGSYLVTNHRLHQVIDGVPVEIAVKRARAKGDGIAVKSAEIIESLIPIRNAVREILRAQENNRPYADAQVALRRAYSRFTRNFGPINRTEIATITDEDTGATKEIVRRPNLAPFADDPDVWLVASIEDYDQETGKARHGAIFNQRVIHPPAPPKIVTASDALTVCLHDTGRVDIGIPTV